MPSISSLLRSAESARKKRAAYQDDVAAFNWQNSAKTSDDWVEYQNYLNTRGASVGDPSEQLSYTKKLKSAEDSYVSAEIEREAIKILEGTGSKQDQLTRVSQLLERAIERGNYDLAQNLYKQGLTLQEQIATQQEAGQRVASAMATTQVKSIKDLVKTLESGTGDEDGLIEVGDNAYKSLYRVGQELKAAGDSTAGLFTDAYATTQAIQSLVEDAYASATTQDAFDYLEKNLRSVRDGTKEYTVAGKKMTGAEIELGYRSALANNPIYSVKTSAGANGEVQFAIQKNKVEDFAWIRNDDGTYEAQAVQTRSVNESLKTRIDNNGQVVTGDDSNDSQTVENRLNALGYGVEAGADGKITITDRNGRIYTDAAIENGKIRFRGDPNEYSRGIDPETGEPYEVSGIYEINLFQQDNFGTLGTKDRPLPAGTVRPVAPDETSDFAQKSEFGGWIGYNSKEGTNAIMGMAGVSKFSTPKFSMDQVVEKLQVKEYSSPGIKYLDGGVGGNYVAGTSGLLQSAGTQRNYLAELNRQQEQAKATARAQQTSQALSLPNTPSLNQTPVRQIATSGAPVDPIKVSTAPTRNRIVNTGYVQPTRKITGVTSAPTRTTKLQVR